METKIYAVNVERKAIDHIFVSATSEDDAMERARILISEGTAEITLGSDGFDEEVVDANEDKPVDRAEQLDLIANDDSYANYLAEDNSSH